jgi:hypothetical protein
MARNPFAPPGAEVADPASTQPAPPGQVKRACQLFAGTLVVGVISMFPGIRVSPPEEAEVPVLATLVVVVLFSAITIWLIMRILQGRNWARWAMLVYLGAGWLFIGPELADEFYRSPISAIVDAICIPVEAAACWLLFTGAGGQWFSTLAAGRKQAGR